MTPKHKRPDWERDARKALAKAIKRITAAMEGARNPPDPSRYGDDDAFDGAVDVCVEQANKMLDAVRQAAAVDEVIAAAISPHLREATGKKPTLCDILDWAYSAGDAAGDAAFERNGVYYSLDRFSQSTHDYHKDRRKDAGAREDDRT